MIRSVALLLAGLLPLATYAQTHTTFFTATNTTAGTALNEFITAFDSRNDCTTLMTKWASPDLSFYSSADSGTSLSDVIDFCESAGGAAYVTVNQWLLDDSPLLPYAAGSYQVVFGHPSDANPTCQVALEYTVQGQVDDYGLLTSVVSLFDIESYNSQFQNCYQYSIYGNVTSSTQSSKKRDMSQESVNKHVARPAYDHAFKRGLLPYNEDPTTTALLSVVDAIAVRDCETLAGLFASDAVIAAPAGLVELTPTEFVEGYCTYAPFSATHLPEVIVAAGMPDAYGVISGHTSFTIDGELQGVPTCTIIYPETFTALLDNSNQISSLNLYLNPADFVGRLYSECDFVYTQ